MTDTKTSSVPTPLHWAALTSVAALMVGVSLIKVRMADIPVHLATGRLIIEDGVLPTTNTFSWTHPDATLFQQYPLFQILLYSIWTIGGFGALSVLTSVLWAGVLATWMRWAGTWRQAAQLAPIWFLAALGIQRHLLLRPEAISLLILGLMLLSFDALVSHGRWRSVVAILGLQWVWANSHQLFVVGIGVQLAFVIHIMLSRRWARFGFSGRGSEVRLVKPLAALVGGLAVSCLTPLGIRSIAVPFQTIGTVLTQGASTGASQSAELASVWTDPIAGFVVIAALIVGLYAGFHSWGRWMWFELALVLLGLALVLVALRGIGFFSVLVVGVSARLWHRHPTTVARRRLHVDVTLLLVIVLCVQLVAGRFTSEPAFLRVQAGMGRSIGEWPDSTIAFLDATRPEGRMLNIGWASGNVLILEGYEVFVDPRWEAYPKQFLLDSIESIDDASVLASQISDWQPTWIVGEMRLPQVQRRMAELVDSGEWQLAHLDTLHLVLIRGVESDASLEVLGWHPEYPVIFAQEKIRVACWYSLRGEVGLTDQLLEEVGVISDSAAVRGDLQRFSQCWES